METSTHDAEEPLGQPEWWWFYCYRCRLWCEVSGPWCAVYKSKPLTSPCYFDEYPERAEGVRFPDPMPPHGNPDLGST